MNILGFKHDSNTVDEAVQKLSSAPAIKQKVVTEAMVTAQVRWKSLVVTIQQKELIEKSIRSILMSMKDVMVSINAPNSTVSEVVDFCKVFMLGEQISDTSGRRK